MGGERDDYQRGKRPIYVGVWCGHGNSARRTHDHPKIPYLVLQEIASEKVGSARSTPARFYRPGFEVQKREVCWRVEETLQTR